ncbi:MAG: transcription termination factor NusA [Candidatus Hydrogenedentes bacterium]|nr:transcription termination factor NusA [Candidatus Hydrogenedentota bacterium]
MESNLRIILQQLEAEKNVDRDTLIEAIRSAIESAARKSMMHAADVTVEVDSEKVEFRVFEIRRVVDEVAEPLSEILLEEARKLNPDVELGNRIKFETQPRDFGRIAAQTAKQVIIQKIKDAERDNIYDEFKNREGEVLTGVVKRQLHGNVIVMVDKAEAIIPPREQAVRESFRPGDRIRALLMEVEKTPRGALVVLSRSSPDLVRALFELEVPEIFDGTIDIKAIAREAGSRTKVAVASNDPNVDPVGACVGMKGSRVRAVVEELSGEKIDIVRWSDNPVELCGHALNPADILDIVLDEENKTVLVTVPHDQLSLAIGKKGQNARLASRLIGWNIDIRSDLELSGKAPPAAGKDSEGDGSGGAPAESAEKTAGESQDASAEAPEKPKSGLAEKAEAVDASAESGAPAEVTTNTESESTEG